MHVEIVALCQTIPGVGSLLFLTHALIVIRLISSGAGSFSRQSGSTSVLSSRRYLHSTLELVPSDRNFRVRCRGSVAAGELKKQSYVI